MKSDNSKSHVKLDENSSNNLFKACALYNINDILYQNGKITLEKKQAVDLEIWKYYHI